MMNAAEISSLWEEIRKKFSEDVDGDKLVSEIREKIRKGRAGYEDAYKFAWQVGNHTANAAKRILARSFFGEDADREAAEKLLRELLEDNYKLIADASQAVQKALNTKAGIGLNAVRPPMNGSRADGIVKWLFDSGGAADFSDEFVRFSSLGVSDSAIEYGKARRAMETVRERAAGLDSKIENYSGSTVTASAAKNAEFQAKAGREAKITRKVAGECCQWCARLAGKYIYSERPTDIFRRHDNCRCLVLFDPGDGSKTDVWTKIDYKSEKDARIAREKEIAAAKANEDRHAKQKNIARDKGEKYIDATEYWQNKPKESPAKLISRNKKFDYNGEHYTVDGHHVKFEPSTDEIATAQWWAERFGGKVELLPKIGYPLGVATPDYLINGEKVDRKALSGVGKNLIDNAIRNKKDQASWFIVDMTNAGISDSEIYAQTAGIMNSKHRSWVQGLFVIKDGEIIQVLERP